MVASSETAFQVSTQSENTSISHKQTKSSLHLKNFKSLSIKLKKRKK